MSLGINFKQKVPSFTSKTNKHNICGVCVVCEWQNLQFKLVIITFLSSLVFILVFSHHLQIMLCVIILYMTDEKYSLMANERNFSRRSAERKSPKNDFFMLCFVDDV